MEWKWRLFQEKLPCSPVASARLQAEHHVLAAGCSQATLADDVPEHLVQACRCSAWALAFLPHPPFSAAKPRCSACPPSCLSQVLLPPYVDSLIPDAWTHRQISSCLVLPFYFISSLKRRRLFPMMNLTTIFNRNLKQKTHTKKPNQPDKHTGL